MRELDVILQENEEYLETLKQENEEYLETLKQEIEVLEDERLAREKMTPGGKDKLTPKDMEKLINARHALNKAKKLTGGDFYFKAKDIFSIMSKISKEDAKAYEKIKENIRMFEEMFKEAPIEKLELETSIRYVSKVKKMVEKFVAIKNELSAMDDKVEQLKTLKYKIEEIYNQIASFNGNSIEMQTVNVIMDGIVEGFVITSKSTLRSDTSYKDIFERLLTIMEKVQLFDDSKKMFSKLFGVKGKSLEHLKKIFKDETVFKNFKISDKEIEKLNETLGNMYLVEIADAVSSLVNDIKDISNTNTTHFTTRSMTVGEYEKSKVKKDYEKAQESGVGVVKESIQDYFTPEEEVLLSVNGILKESLSEGAKEYFKATIAWFKAVISKLNSMFKKIIKLLSERKRLIDKEIVIGNIFINKFSDMHQDLSYASQVRKKMLTESVEEEIETKVIVEDKSTNRYLKF